MGLAETQRALARLYTDAALRERFFADPSKVGEELGLADDEAQQLAQMPERETRYFAASLVNKRLGEVSKLLPRTHEVLGQEFRKLFRQYAETYVPQGLRKHLRDAVRFAQFAERHGRLRTIAPPWAVELLRYEKEHLRAREPGPRLIVRYFRYPVDELASGAVKGSAAEVRPTLALWLRASGRGPVRHRVWSWPAGR